MTAPGESHASTGQATPTPDVIASVWLMHFTRAHRPVLVRWASWIPVILVPVIVFSSSIVGIISLTVGGLLMLAGVVTSTALLRRNQPLLPVLTELAEFPEPTTPRHLAVVARVLHEAHSALAAFPVLTTQRAAEIVRHAALRLFVVADATGCSAGHSAVCRHRRDNDAWMHWIAPDEHHSAFAPAVTDQAGDQ